MKEVILKEDIRSVGQAGEVVKVSEGYARNFLLPQRKGVLANAANLKKLEAERAAIEKRRQKQREEAVVLAEKIRGIRVVLKRETGEETRLFGQVTTRQIAEALVQQGISLDHRSFHLKEPIRTVGSFKVEIHLQGGELAELTVDVEKK